MFVGNFQNIKKHPDAPHCIMIFLDYQEVLFSKKKTARVLAHSRCLLRPDSELGSRRFPLHRDHHRIRFGEGECLLASERFRPEQCYGIEGLANGHAVSPAETFAGGIFGELRREREPPVIEQESEARDGVHHVLQLCRQTAAIGEDRDPRENQVDGPHRQKFELSSARPDDAADDAAMG